MITVTPKVEDVDLINKTFYIFIGAHGFPMSIDRLKESVAKVRNEEVTQDMLYVICTQKIWAESQRLGINVKDMTLIQIKTAIETVTEI